MLYQALMHSRVHSFSSVRGRAAERAVADEGLAPLPCARRELGGQKAKGKRQNRTLVSFCASFVQDPVTLMTFTLVELLMKKTPFAWMALGAWIFSLCLPMIYSDGRRVFGVQLFIMGFAALPFFFFALLHSRPCKTPHHPHRS